MHVYIFKVKLLPARYPRNCFNNSEVQFDITTCKCDLRMLNLTCKHLQLYINLYSYRELQRFIPGSKNTR